MGLLEIARKRREERESRSRRDEGVKVEKKLVREGYRKEEIGSVGRVVDEISCTRWCLRIAWYEWVLLDTVSSKGFRQRRSPRAFDATGCWKSWLDLRRYRSVRHASSYPDRMDEEGRERERGKRVLGRGS